MSKFIDPNVTAEISLFFIPGFIIFMLLPSIHMHAQPFDLEDQLILWLPIDGNAIDQSGNNITTIVSGPVLAADRFGVAASAYKFDGIDDCINLNSNKPVITANDFTIALWVKVDGASSTISNSLFQQRHRETDPSITKSIIHFSAEVAGEAYLSVRTSEHSNQPAAKLTCNFLEYGEWHHYVAVKERDQRKIYIDGHLCSTITSDEPGNLTTSIDYVDIGLHKYYFNEIKGALNGCIDDVYIYDRALNDCEIQYIYAGSLPEER